MTPMTHDADINGQQVPAAAGARNGVDTDRVDCRVYIRSGSEATRVWIYNNQPSEEEYGATAGGHAEKTLSAVRFSCKKVCSGRRGTAETTMEATGDYARISRATGRGYEAWVD